MSQSERRPEGSESFAGVSITAVTMLDLNEPIIVAIPFEPGHPVARNFILEVNVGNGRADIMGMESFLRGGMA